MNELSAILVLLASSLVLNGATGLPTTDNLLGKENRDDRLEGESNFSSSRYEPRPIDVDGTNAGTDADEDEFDKDLLEPEIYEEIEEVFVDPEPYESAPETQYPPPTEQDYADREEVQELPIIPELAWTVGKTEEASTPSAKGEIHAPVSRAVPFETETPKEPPNDAAPYAWQLGHHDGSIRFRSDEGKRVHAEKSLDLENSERVGRIDVHNQREEDEFIDTSNSVRRTRNLWPVRDMDRLGSRPYNTACIQPMMPGVGPEEQSSWYYSLPDGRCLWFPYKGHQGNANRFFTRDACDAACVYDQTDLCESANCRTSRSSRCILRGDEKCKREVRERRGNRATECPPDQPVCQNERRTIYLPTVDTNRIPEECKEHRDPGSCVIKSPLIRYYYDAQSNTCLHFYFHACGGNNNRFETMADCMNHCSL